MKKSTKDTAGSKPKSNLEAFDGTRRVFPCGFPRTNLDGHTRRLANWLKKNVKGSCTTPFFADPFVDWLIYDCTIGPCGLRLESIEEDVVTFEANCSGVQTQGICLSATFRIPTKEFTTADFVKMIGPYRYHKHGPVCRFEWFPQLDDPRLTGENVTELEWWYDDYYDEEDEDGGEG